MISYWNNVVSCALKPTNRPVFVSDSKSVFSRFHPLAHYDGFNKAIKNYTQILGLVTSTGSNNSTLTQNAAKCNALFTSRSHSVNTMYLQSLEYSYMIEILDKMYVTCLATYARGRLETPN